MMYIKQSLSKYLAEMVGTFCLALVILLVVLGGAGGGVGVPMIAGLTLALLIYTIGMISGSHVNPAITLGALSLNKIHWKDALGYVVFQFIGALIALGVVILLASRPGVNFWEVTKPLADAWAGTAFNLRLGVAEAMGGLFYGFGFAAVLYGRVTKGLSGFVIGGSLILGTLIAIVLGSGGILNPALAMTVRALNFMYVVGPVVGVIAGMWLYTLIIAFENNETERVKAVSTSSTTKKASSSRRTTNKAK